MNILLVDDDTLVLGAMTASLELSGHYCTPFSDALSALIEYQNNKFDFVLVDYKMPFINGFDLTKQILNINNSAKIIMYTGETDKIIKDKAIKQGAKAFLFKPFEIKELNKLFDEL